MRSRNVAMLLGALLLTTSPVGLLGCGGNSSGGSPGSVDDGVASPVVAGVYPEQAIAEVEAAEVPAGVDAALWEELTAELKRVLSVRQATQNVQHPPQGEHNRVTDLRLVPDADVTWRLEWSYVNVGDLNLDGLVSINDLTPIGQYFNARAGDPDWDSAQVADGNGDGMVTISDITPIGQNYLSMVAGYRIFGADSADASEAEWQASWQAWADAYVPGPRAFYPEVPFDGAGNEQSPGFSCPLYRLDYNFYKVAPYDSDGSQGAESYIEDWLTGGGPWHMFGHDRKHTRRSPNVGAQTNALKWTYTTGGWMASSPAVGADGTVYVGSGDSKLYAVNPDGSLKWSYTTGGQVDSSPAIDAHGTVYVGSYDGNLYAVKPDGSLKWSYFAASAVKSSPAVGVDGTVYVASFDGDVYAVKPDGSLKWSYATGHWMDSSPAIGADGTVYVGSWYETGVGGDRLYAITASGGLKWSYTAVDAVHSSPAIAADGTVYVGSCDYQLYALNPDGSLKWSYATADEVRSSPAIGADGTVYVGSWDQQLHAINPDGSPQWSYPMGDEVGSSPAVGADGTVYVGSSNGMLRALNPDGTIKWSYDTGNYVNSPAIGADGTVYVTSNNKLFAFGP